MGISFEQGGNDLFFDALGLNIGRVIGSFFDSLFGFGGSGAGDMAGGLADTLAAWWSVYSLIAIILSILFFLGYIYARIRYEQLGASIMDGFINDERLWAETYGRGAGGNARWLSILDHSRRDNPNDWRIAIIEADIMLDETLDGAGYVGATVAERLKGAQSNPFRSYRDAWNAHLVRNKIAHAGSDFVLTKKIAQETIVQYERVFKEFGVI